MSAKVAVAHPVEVAEATQPEAAKSVDAINAQDLKNVRKEFLFALPEAIESRFMGMLTDKRDIVMVRLMANISLTMIPCAALLFYLKSFSVYLGIAYVAVFYALYIQRFMLTLHFASHKKLFSKGNPLNNYSQYVLAPFFGVPSGMYYFHHVVMHHIENNVFPYDVSATMQYQRDNIFHFLHYWLRYVINIWVALPYYLYKRGRYSLLARCAGSMLFYFLAVAALYRISPQATFFTFVAPYLVSSLLLMFGNWSQHILVNPKNHEDSFNLAYNIINTEMNTMTYNDGYHIGHHVHSTLHWSELPNWFNRNIDKLAEKGSFTFRELDYAAIGFLCMTGQLEKLANYYVNIGPKETHRTKEQVISTMKEWFKPIPY
jgi:fatty acid desaturase